MSTSEVLVAQTGHRPIMPFGALRSRRWPAYRRWPVIAACIIALAGLCQASLTEAGRPRRLGLRAEERGGQLVVAWVQPGGFAWDIGVRPGDTILAIDGHPALAGDAAAAAGADRLLARTRADTLITATTGSAPMLATGLARLTFLAIALSFVVVGSVVFLLAVDVRVATIFLIFSTVTAIALIVAIATVGGAGWALAAEFVAVVGAGGATLLLFLAFPIDRLRNPFGRRMAALCLATTATLVAAYGWVVIVQSAAYAVVQRAAFATLLAELLIVGALIAAAIGATSRARRRARHVLVVVALGNIAGLVPFCLLVLVPSLLGRPYVVGPDVAILSVVFVPTSLGAAVLSHQFLAMARMIHRSMLAVVVWTLLLGGYSAGLAALHTLLVARQPPPPSARGWIALGVVLVGGTFPVAQARLRRGLERFLFRDSYHYAETLRRLSADIVHLRSVEQIVDYVLTRLVTTLDLRWAAIALDADGRQGAQYRAVPGQRIPPIEEGTSGDGRHLPLVTDGTAIGSLFTGAKRDDAEYLVEDHALLDTITPLVATTLQNALLVRQLEGQLAALAARERALAALSARLMRVQEEERQHLSLDLHDDPLQRAIQLTRELSNAPYDPLVWGWREEAEEIATALRAICAGLHPPVLNDLGLTVGIERLVNDARARADLVIWLVVEGPAGEPFGRLEAPLEVALYRVAQEALNNCLKHAAASVATVVLRRDARGVALTVADDGVGLPEGVPARPAQPIHLGILGMQERVRPWGGVVTVGNGPSGGTILTAVLDLPTVGRGER